MTEQIEKIKKLIARSINPKQKAMYQQLLAKLEAEIKPEVESEVEVKTNQLPPEPVQPPTPIEPAFNTEINPPQEPEEEKLQTTSFFQAIGIITGEVTLTPESSSIKIGEKDYPLYIIPGRRKSVYEPLKKHIETTGTSLQKLIVYPKILHFPNKEKLHLVAFQLVAFFSENNQKQSTLHSVLNDFEFRLCGLWQFIPVCRTPCISIFKNFSKERLDFIKGQDVDVAKKVKFMKASHLPLLWKDSPVKPFRFNPKLEKQEQEKTYFVEIKARFLPNKDVFGFVELLSEPTTNLPKFIKASKKMKGEVLKQAKSKLRDVEATSETEPVETVTVVDVESSDNTPTSPTLNIESTAEMQPVTENHPAFNPDQANLDELKNYIRGIQSDDETRKYGKLSLKSTWITAFKNIKLDTKN